MVQAPGVSTTSTEDSRASRPKRAVERFDYNVLNGTSGNLGALLQAGEKEKEQVAKTKEGKK